MHSWTSICLPTSLSARHVIPNPITETRLEKTHGGSRAAIVCFWIKPVPETSAPLKVQLRGENSLLLTADKNWAHFVWVRVGLRGLRYWVRIAAIAMNRKKKIRYISSTRILHNKRLPCGQSQRRELASKTTTYCVYLSAEFNNSSEKRC